jgi:hypothetical protein
VIGERIRDKFAASRRKGMWMGGTLPLGYDVVDRKHVVNEKEAELVRLIFKRFLRVGSATKLAQELRRAGHTTSWASEPISPRSSARLALTSASTVRWRASGLRSSNAVRATSTLRDTSPSPRILSPHRRLPLANLLPDVYFVTSVGKWADGSTPIDYPGLTLRSRSTRSNAC